MTRNEIINRIGTLYHTTNIEGGEYSYVKDAGGRKKLEEILGHTVEHYKLDIRFESRSVVVLVETKQIYVESDKTQLAEYVCEEKALHPGNKIIAILANTNNNDFLAYQNEVDDAHRLSNETVFEDMDHYVSLFEVRVQNNREKVLKNTFDLNILLHKNNIQESLRSQFVGTALLYIKKKVQESGLSKIDEQMKARLNGVWSNMSKDAIRAEIGSTLTALLDGSVNKQKKVELLQKNVLDNQNVRDLSKENWIEILDKILFDIYKYINVDSSEGQDILNMFFIAFNKYTGRTDKNQAFTPDHITEFMCRVTEVDHTKVVLDGTCGSASFLVQAMVKELADCRRNHTEKEATALMEEVKRCHIYGIEVEEKAFGLSTTNMLIHGDGNSNIILGSLFDNEGFIREASPDIILMNPPYNSKPKSIPNFYKTTWGKAKDGKADPTKGFVFVQFISDVIRRMNDERERRHEPRKEVKMAVLLPVSAAIGTSSILTSSKKEILKDNTLEAVFTLPDDIFYPGASVCVCCMVFTLGRPHIKYDGTVNKTFFGYYKDDGFKKKKNLGRIEQFDDSNLSLWKEIEERWLSIYRNKEVIDGLSSTAIVDGESEWLCEAYMRTDYSKLNERHFRNVVNDYLAHLVKVEKINEDDWMFMENYIKSFHTNSNTFLGEKKKSEISTIGWKEFRLNEVFTLKGGFYNKKPEHSIEGDFPFLGSTESNNGVTEKYCLDDIFLWDKVGGQDNTFDKKIFDGNCIAVTVNGSVCNAYYQKEKFTCSHDITVLYLKKHEMNQHIAFFLCAVIMMDKYRWSYGRKPHDVKKFGQSIIKLPVLSDGTPDWDYMEGYINNLPYGN